MVIKYILLLLVILAIHIILKKRYSIEHFNKTPIVSMDLELLENTEIVGSFTPSNLDGNIDINIEKTNISFSLKDKKVVINNLYKIDLNYAVGTVYNYKIILFPSDNYILLEINDNVIYSNFLKSVRLENGKIELLGDNTHKVSKFINTKSQLQLLKTHSGLYKIGNEIWNVEKLDNHYVSLINIKNNLYLGIEKNDTVSKPDNQLLIIKDKDNYILLNKLGKKSNIHLDKVVNTDTWLSYGSTINIVNNKKQYLSSNRNIKYDFKGSSGLPAVYCDNIASNELISWTIEGKPKTEIIKKDNVIYLKNNNLYLQIIHGNPTANKVGVEISMGDQKNDNSKWIIISTSDDRLFKKDSNVYLYHPNTESYLYNTGKDFTIVKTKKSEVVGLDIKDNNAIWTISNLILPPMNNEHDNIDYYTFDKEKRYINKREREWKKLLDSENEKVKEGLRKFNKLKGISDDIETGINKVKVDIDTISKTKCPPRKICLNSIDYNCIPPKMSIDNEKASGEYDIIYEKKPRNIFRKDLINTNMVTPCDYISIESIPEDKKITDFKINELSGFNKLQLKIT
jgi:hypothetical protein